MPHVSLAHIGHLDFEALRAMGCKGIIFDKVSTRACALHRQRLRDVVCMLRCVVWPSIGYIYASAASSKPKPDLSLLLLWMAVVFPQDNTLTAPYEDATHPLVEEGLRRCMEVFEGRVCIMSNSAGTRYVVHGFLFFFLSAFLP